LPSTPPFSAILRSACFRQFLSKVFLRPRCWYFSFTRMTILQARPLGCSWILPPLKGPLVVHPTLCGIYLQLSHVAVFRPPIRPSLFLSPRAPRVNVLRSASSARSLFAYPSRFHGRAFGLSLCVPPVFFLCFHVERSAKDCPARQAITWVVRSTSTKRSKTRPRVASGHYRHHERVRASVPASASPIPLTI